MTSSFMQKLRIGLRRLHGGTYGKHWFPHLPIAILTALGGIWLLQGDLGSHWELFAVNLLHGQAHIPPSVLPPLLIGVGMIIMALGLLFRSRLAWIMALLLVITAVASLFFGVHPNGHVLLAYFIVTLVLLLLSWRRFDHSSITAGTLFALTSVVMLILYAAFGTYYLGDGFDPPIKDLVTALYFSMVTMSTVGYGDISPQTTEAMLFTVSVIVLGVAVFATSLTAVIAPMVSHSLKRIVQHKGSSMKRENHYIIIGTSPLANNTWRELSQRGQPVTRIVRDAALLDKAETDTTDIVVGDPGSISTLREAGGAKATAIVAMLDDDSENAFCILAARELESKARTIAAVNDAKHLERIRLVQPDTIIAPEIFGGELAAMMLCGETISSSQILNKVFQEQNKRKTPSVSA